ncbi:MAG TPA: hypothetical protein VKD22_17975 [Ramlibacter sp.]|nr:hypothetical protein [Ramlibacter sp.]
MLPAAAAENLMETVRSAKTLWHPHDAATLNAAAPKLELRDLLVGAQQPYVLSHVSVCGQTLRTHWAEPALIVEHDAALVDLREHPSVALRDFSILRSPGRAPSFSYPGFKWTPP